LKEKLQNYLLCPTCAAAVQHTIVFDHLIAPTAFYISGDEFADWWREIGVSDADVNWHNSNSSRGFGKIR